MRKEDFDKKNNGTGAKTAQTQKKEQNTYFYCCNRCAFRAVAV